MTNPKPNSAPPPAGNGRQTVRVTRTAQVPDPDRLERYLRYPEVGPRPLLFGGGSALRDLCRALVHYTHNSIHLVTPFDSGGSSRHLRRAFRMLAVGDLRNRLLALADTSVRGQPAIFRLFAYRFSKDRSESELRVRLRALVEGKGEMVEAVDLPMRQIICSHLRHFAEQMPESFSLRGANIGNLILTGGYLNQGRRIDPVIFLFSRLVEVRGLVRPTSTRPLHLVSELADATVLPEQHLLTGKDVSPIASPVRRVYLSANKSRPTPLEVPIHPHTEELIEQADLICYPMGSFYSSLIAGLLPHGMGRAIAARDVPKVYLPNLGTDPEQLGMSLLDQVKTLLHYLRAGGAPRAATADLLHYIILDKEQALRESRSLQAVARLGIQPIALPLVSQASAPLTDGEMVARALLSLT